MLLLLYLRRWLTELATEWISYAGKPFYLVVINLFRNLLPMQWLSVTCNSAKSARHARTFTTNKQIPRK